MKRVLVLAVAMLLSVLVVPRAYAAPSLPNSMAGLGDSITRAADVCCWYGDHPAQSWTTGYARSDGISSHYERLAAVGFQLAKSARWTTSTQVLAARPRSPR
jgi:hypothetical protein